MSNHNHKQQSHQGPANIHPVDSSSNHILEPEVMHGPSPSGLASSIAVGGKLADVRDRLRSRCGSAMARIETASEQIAQTFEAQAVFHEQMNRESAERYEETVKFFRGLGS
jgi:hypothetical protein